MMTSLLLTGWWTGRDSVLFIETGRPRIWDQPGGSPFQPNSASQRREGTGDNENREALR